MTENNSKFYITTFHDYSKDTYVEGLNKHVIYRKAKLCPWNKPHRSLFLFRKNNQFRLLIQFIEKSKLFEAIILLAILANCIVMSMYVQLPSNDSTKLNDKLEQSEVYFILIFLVEAIIKIISYGFILHKKSYLRNGWNILDFAIVLIGIIIFIISKLQVASSVDVKALRAFRVLRPLRLVSNIPSLQVVLNSIILAMKPLADIAILILFLMVVYSIVGLDLFMGKLHATCYNNVTLAIMDNPSPCRLDVGSTGYFCTGLPELPGGQQWTCLDRKNTTMPETRWIGPNNGITSFDNMGLGMLTVFQIITQEGWTDNMYLVNDSLGSEWPWAYFVSLVLLVTFFFLNLILGVLSGEFSKQSAKIVEQKQYQKEKKYTFNNEAYIGYKSWIEYAEKLEDIHNENIQSVITSDYMRENVMNYNGKVYKEVKIISLKNKWKNLYAKLNNYHVRFQKSLRTLIKSRIYFIIILVLVFLNMVIMATEFSNQPNWLNDFQNYSNMVFVIIFTLELVLKMITIGWQEYFSKLFNIFDSIVIFCSILEIFLVSNRVMNPIGLAVFRCARLLRGFKLTQYWENLRLLVQNMLHSMKSILSLLLLLGLFILIFLLLGMQLFGGKLTELDPPRSNFNTFHNALFTVFQILTGDDWNTVMYSGMNGYNGIQGSGGYFALYFLCLYIIGNYILLNVFVAIAVESLRTEEDDEEKDNESSNTNETDIQERNQNIDTEAKQPEITEHLVVINGCAMLPPVVKSDIVSLSKIKNKSKKRINPEQRVRINFEVEEEIEESEELNPEFSKTTYNELYAEEEIDDQNDEPVRATLIPKLGDFKRLKEKDIPIPTGSAFFIFKDSNIFRIKCFMIVNHSLCKNMILVCIIMSSIMLAAEDPVDENSGRNNALGKFDYIFTAIFGLELISKMIAYGVIFHKNAFLRNPFNWIDFVVVIIGIIINAMPKDSNNGISAVKTLRVLRVLRPLRAINRAKGLKHVLKCVLVAIKSIAKIMIITFLLEFMFAVMGVIMLKGTFYSCSDPSKMTAATCRGYYFIYPTSDNTPVKVAGRVWLNNPLNFDNVFSAMLTLFVVSTFSGWKLLLYLSIDATKEGKGPYLNNNNIIFLYYLIYIIIIAFFMINLFVGMVVVTFQKEGDAEFAKYKLDKNKRQCIDFALKARPIIRYVPKDKMRYKVWKFVISKKFDNFITVLILMNTVCLMITYVNETQLYVDVLKYLNMLFTIIFTVECLLKAYAFSIRNYFNDGMNVFDSIVIAGSYVDIIFSSIDTGDGSMRINLFQLFRVFRLIRLLSKIESIRRLLWTFVQSFKSLPYVMLLIILAFFIFGVMGMQFFGKIGLENNDSEITRNNNFQTFYSSILVLFRCVTGENWHLIMLSCIYDPIATCTNSTLICGTSLSYVYFTSFVMLCTFLIMNLFVAVIVDNFDYLTRDSSILGAHHLQDFLLAWSQYDVDARGGMKHLDVINMLSNIDPPLGFGKMCPQVKAFRNLIKLNIPLQTDGTVLFNATLFALVRKGLKIKYSDNVDDKQFLKQYNDDLRIILKTYWKSTNSRLMDQVIPPNIKESVTIAMFFATFIIENWYKKTRMVIYKSNIENGNNEVSKPTKPMLTVKIANKIKNKDVVDNISNTPSESTINSIKEAYDIFTDKVWLALTDIFTIPEENDS